MTTDKTQLAILLPTFRFDLRAQDALKAAAATGSREISVHIADNSENPDKHRFLAELGKASENVFVYCHERNIGAYANWLFLLGVHDAPFVCLAADDDIFFPAYFRAGLEIMSSDPACAVASGLFVSIASQSDVERLVFDSQPARLELSPLERLDGYKGQNAIAYAVTRRTVVDGFAGYVRSNPINGPFNDYLLTFHLLSMGTYRTNPAGAAYLYDNSAWQFIDEEAKSTAKFYVQCGLPDTFHHLFKLHWAVSNLHFFESQFRSPSLSSEEASRIAVNLYDRLRVEAKWDCDLKRPEIDALFEGKDDAYDAFAALVVQPYSHDVRAFDLFASIVAAFSPDLAKRLLEFQSSTLLPGFEGGPA